MEQSDYLKYRGKCKKFCLKAIQEDPTLTLVRGHYYCPIWNTNEQHWWTTKEDGTIYDPTKKQFASKGTGTYTEFSGMCSCETCGKEIKEKDAVVMGNYACCSPRCAKILVGL
jgi:hypothetical protein